MIDALERAVRLAGLLGLLSAWGISGTEAWRARDREVGPGFGLAPRLGALATYLLTAVPYFLVWVVLWRPISGHLADPLRLVLLVVGAAFGSASSALGIGVDRAGTPRSSLREVEIDRDRQ